MTETKKKTTRFRYLDKVIVIKGKHKGKEGMILQSIRGRLGGTMYNISTSEGTLHCVGRSEIVKLKKHG